MNQPVYEFPGWEPPLENWSKLPHAFIMLMPQMKLSELRVTLYILRHTWGFGNYSNLQPMSIDELRHGRKVKGGTRIDNGTGLSKQSVLTGLKAGLTRGTIEVTVDETDRARIKKAYRLRSLIIGQEGSNFWTAEVKNLDPDLNKDTYKDNLPSPAATTALPTKRKPTVRDEFSIELERSFCNATRLPLPPRTTSRERKAAGTRWSNPLWHMYDLFRPEEERNDAGVKRQYDHDSLSRAVGLISQAVKHMRTEKLTISAPASIEQVAMSIYADGYRHEASSDAFWEEHIR